MTPTRRDWIAGLAAVPVSARSAEVTRYVRFRRGSTSVFGVLEGTSIRPLKGDLLGAHSPAGAAYPSREVKFLTPITPPKILAIGRNYKSHIGNLKPPSRPEIFYKPISALLDPEGEIRIPKGSTNVHYEGELVLVIGKEARHVSESQAREVIFGVTCGNDVSERDWQNGPDKDMQWWRAKGADTFAPLGPVIACGLDYSRLMLETRVNGKVVQKQSTADLLFGPEALVSFISRNVTLMPGDVIYTGTPGTTSRMNPGDVVEVEIEGVGILRNRVVAG